MCCNDGSDFIVERFQRPNENQARIAFFLLGHRIYLVNSLSALVTGLIWVVESFLKNEFRLFLFQLKPQFATARFSVALH